MTNGQRTLFLTGASSGIGRALAIRAARAGYAIYGVGRNAGALALLEERIKADGGTIATASADIGDPANAPRLIANCMARFGRIDVLCNNAGAVAVGPIGRQSDAALREQFATHVIGPLALTREAHAALQATHGQVIMLGSGVARIAVGGLGAYAAAKAAIKSATQTLRRELKADGIAVTYVDPGAVDTPFMTRAGMPGAPARFLVSPETVARAIFNGFTTRPREVNAVPWQVALLSFAENFPQLIDFVLERAPQLVGGTDQIPLAPVDAPKIVAPPAATPPRPAPADETPPARTESLLEALEPHARKMEKLSLKTSFVRGLLVRGATLELGDVSQRWAGMPNKNERALTAAVLLALEEAGFLESMGPDRWLVVRGD